MLRVFSRCFRPSEQRNPRQQRNTSQQGDLHFSPSRQELVTSPSKTPRRTPTRGNPPNTPQSLRSVEQGASYQSPLKRMAGSSGIKNQNLEQAMRRYSGRNDDRSKQIHGALAKVKTFLNKHKTFKEVGLMGLYRLKQSRHGDQIKGISRYDTVEVEYFSHSISIKLSSSQYLSNGPHYIDHQETRAELLRQALNCLVSSNLTAPPVSQRSSINDVLLFVSNKLPNCLISESNYNLECFQWSRNLVDDQSSEQKHTEGRSVYYGGRMYSSQQDFQHAVIIKYSKLHATDEQTSSRLPNHTRLVEESNRLKEEKRELAVLKNQHTAEIKALTAAQEAATTAHAEEKTQLEEQIAQSTEQLATLRTKHEAALATVQSEYEAATTAHAAEKTQLEEQIAAKEQELTEARAAQTATEQTHTEAQETLRTELATATAEHEAAQTAATSALATAQSEYEAATTAHAAEKSQLEAKIKALEDNHAVKLETARKTREIAMMSAEDLATQATNKLEAALIRTFALQNQLYENITLSIMEKENMELGWHKSAKLTYLPPGIESLLQELEWFTKDTDLPPSIDSLLQEKVERYKKELKSIEKKLKTRKMDDFNLLESVAATTDDEVDFNLLESVAATTDDEVPIGLLKKRQTMYKKLIKKAQAIMDIGAQSEKSPAYSAAGMSRKTSPPPTNEQIDTSKNPNSNHPIMKNCTNNGKHRQG